MRIESPFREHIRSTRVGLLAPDFEPVPTFEYYAGALALWISAFEYTSGGDPEYVTNNPPSRRL
jgi:hypothetical protein